VKPKHLQRSFLNEDPVKEKRSQLVQKELAEHLLQMFLSKQINWRAVNIEDMFVPPRPLP